MIGFPIGFGLMMVAQVLVFLLGTALVLVTLGSAVHTVVIPRADHSWITTATMRLAMSCLLFRTRFSRTEEHREQVLASIPGFGLISLPLTWVALTIIGFAGMFWATSNDLTHALSLSASSITTLGMVAADGNFELALAAVEATIGLGIVALLISFLPTMYTNFSEREVVVSKFATRAGSPPRVSVFITRAHGIGWLEDQLASYWLEWEDWFVRIEEAQTSYPALNFFRSPLPENSWINAAGAVLDTAAMRISVVDYPPSPEAHLCIRTGFLALRRIADYFGLEYDADPDPTDPISITRAEFDAEVAAMAEAGVPIKTDLDQAWRDFSGWRVNYDSVLLSLCWLVRAPSAPWSSDRATHAHRRRQPSR